MDSRTLYKVSDLGFKDIKTPQMKALVKTVKEAKKDELNSSSFTAQDLVSLAVKKKELSTRQDPLRIFRFYAKRLTDEGYFIKV